MKRKMNMFRINVLRDQWVILIISAGLSLICLTTLFYLDLWRHREHSDKDEKEDEMKSDEEKRQVSEKYKTNYLSYSDGITWSLKALIAVISIFSILYTIFIILLNSIILYLLTIE
jgi:uncharacterized membrane protein